MKLKLARKAVCCAMAAAMAAMMMPAQAIADAGDAGSYLSEVAVAYGDDGVDQLEAEGYEVVEGSQGAADVNAGNGTATYIGYKSTDDPSQAITDLAVMNMKGGYSISAWKDELENLSNQATAKAYEFSPVIKELRANYKAAPDDYKGTIDLLNDYTEDDSGMGMGNFLLDTEKCTAGTLANVMLQSNPETFLAVEYLLSKAVATDWTDKVTSLKMDKSYDVDDEAVQAVVDQILILRKNLVAYEKSQVKVDDVSDDIAGAMEDADTQSKATEVSNALKYGSVYEALKAIEYGDSGKTMLELFLTSEKYLTTEDVAPLASLLTAGQLKIMPVVGIDTLVLDSVDLGTKAQNAALSATQQAVSDQMSDAGVKAVSMYEGVNRDIFTKDNVALTSDAIRQRSMIGDSDNSMFFNNTASKVMYAITTSAILFSWYCYTQRASFVAKTEDTAATLTTVMKRSMTDEYSHTIEYQTASASARSWGIACGVLAAIACIASGIGIAIDLYNYNHHKERYTIPDIIVDKVDYTDEDGEEGSDYVAYEVARLLDGSAADMNGGSGTWNCLYYTTSKKAGDPITVDELVSSTNNTMTGVDNKSLPAVHAFGETAALNLNGKSNASYLFFARDAEAFADGNSGSDATASAFGAGYLVLAAGIALVVGLGGGFAIGRRKKDDAA